MKFRLLFLAIILHFASSCAPRVLCPAYSVNDAQAPHEQTEVQQANMRM